MKPKFKDTQAWEQAQLLMQPAFIRLIDNIRKQLEQSAWKGTYQDIQTPLPGYHLCLTRKDESVEVDMWDLCFQVCFRNYNPQEVEVEVDTSLIDETGDVDWQLLDNKVREKVEQIFNNLPGE